MGWEFIDGNEAIARGAIRAGCTFFAGYPITPASPILHHMLEWVPAGGGVAIQAEDEIASVGFCIGAAMAGRRAMTATSGPGLSLYSENIGMAIIGETPLVVVDVQRQGPATGSATKGAEGDIQFARWGTSGGLPVIALSPGSVAECYALSYRAFDLADRYRVPVFILTSKDLGMTRTRVDLARVELPPPAPRPTPAADETWQPYGFDRPEDVPAIVPFGADRVTRYTTSTHDQAGSLTTDAAVIRRMIEHYDAKISRAVDALSFVRRDFQAGADTLFVSYGVTSQAVAAAVRQARAAGHAISSLVLQTLWPVPEPAIREALAGVRRVVVPELNLGQYRREIERLAPDHVEVVGVNRMDTTLIPPAEILAAAGLR